MNKEIKRSITTAIDLSTKIQFGLQYIVEALEQGKDVSAWLRQIEDLEKELEILNQKLDLQQMEDLAS